MPTLRNRLALLLLVIASATVLGAKPIPGPKGGKIVTTEAPHVEFFVAPDRTVVVSFYDRDLRPVAPATEIVSATAEVPSGKSTLRFTVKDGALVSSAPLPEGDGYRVVLHVRARAGDRPRNYRLEFHAETCGECQRAEYACVCADAGGDAHGH